MSPDKNKVPRVSATIGTAGEMTCNIRSKIGGSSDTLTPQRWHCDSSSFDGRIIHSARCWLRELRY